jgi:hypothetical protein
MRRGVSGNWREVAPTVYGKLARATDLLHQSQAMFMLRGRVSFRVLASLLILSGCDSSSTPLVVAGCHAIAQATPLVGRIPLGTAITVATTQEGGCPAPLVRNETPSIIRIDTAGAPPRIRVTGVAIGEGRVRVRSGVDTLVSVTLEMTVFAP